MAAQSRPRFDIRPADRAGTEAPADPPPDFGMPPVEVERDCWEFRPPKVSQKVLPTGIPFQEDLDRLPSGLAALLWCVQPVLMLRGCRQSVAEVGIKDVVADRNSRAALNSQPYDRSSMIVFAISGE